MLYAIVIDPVYRDIQNVAHRVQVVKGVDGLNRGPTAMELRCSVQRRVAELRVESQHVARRGNASHCEARRWDAPAPLVSGTEAVGVRSLIVRSGDDG